MSLVPYVLDAARGALILAAGLAALPLLRRAPASARRLVLVMALGAALGAPLAARLVAGSRVARVAELPVVVREPAIDPIVDAAGATPAVATAAAVAAARDAGAVAPSRGWAPTWRHGLAAAWAIGALAVLARLGLGLAHARRLVRRATMGVPPARAAVSAAAQRDAGARARVAISGEVDGPAVAGLFAPVILMPNAALGWSDQRWRLVLLHELAHVRRRDNLASVVAQLACALHWFDPLAWLVARRLRHEREVAADEQVVAAGSRATDYAAHLVAIAAAAHGRAAPGALAMAQPRSQLAARIIALVEADPRPRRSRPRLIAATSGSLALAVACAGPQVAPARDADAQPAAPATSGLADEVAAAVGSPPARIELTIDPALQQIVDDEMPRLVAEWRTAAATAIILEPATGAIVALSEPATARRAYVTGSTLKTITIAAALDTGVIQPDQRFDCQDGTRRYGTRTLHDASAWRMLDVGQVLAVSSNTGASRIFDRLGGERLGTYLTRFHFGEGSTVQLANVGHGQVPAMAELSDYDGAVVAIGEGLTATPLQMAAAYGALANGGEYVAPTLVRRVVDAAGRATFTHTPTRQRIIRADTARAVMTMLEGVVAGDQATGTRARVQGVRVAGKTGTAVWTTPDGALHRYASFVGVVPADAPRYVILVGAESPRDDAPGGQVAAPTFARIAARALAAP